jgi:hypothetical protein
MAPIAKRFDTPDKLPDKTGGRSRQAKDMADMSGLGHMKTSRSVL